MICYRSYAFIILTAIFTLEYQYVKGMWAHSTCHAFYKADNFYNSYRENDAFNLPLRFWMKQGMKQVNKYSLTIGKGRALYIVFLVFLESNRGTPVYIHFCTNPFQSRLWYFASGEIWRPLFTKCSTQSFGLEVSYRQLLQGTHDTRGQERHGRTCPRKRCRREGWQRGGGASRKASRDALKVTGKLGRRKQRIT